MDALEYFFSMDKNEIVDLLIILVSTYLIARFTASYRKSYMIANYRKKIKNKYEKEKCTTGHEWVELTVDYKKSLVCKKCCWCPSANNFVVRSNLDLELGRLDFERKLEEYKKERIEDIRSKYNLTEESVADIYDNFISIKKDFTIKSINKIMGEMKKEQAEKEITKKE
jgi:hypothetical protein